MDGACAPAVGTGFTEFDACSALRGFVLVRGGIMALIIRRTARSLADGHFRAGTVYRYRRDALRVSRDGG